MASGWPDDFGDLLSATLPQDAYGNDQMLDDAFDPQSPFGSGNSGGFVMPKMEEPQDPQQQRLQAPQRTKATKQPSR